MTSTQFIDSSNLASLAERAFLGTDGLARSTALDDLASALRLREAMERDPLLRARLEGGYTDRYESMGEWFAQWQDDGWKNMRAGRGRTMGGGQAFDPDGRPVIDITTGQPVQQRDNTTTDFGSAVPPRILWDQWLPTVGARTIVDELAIIPDLGDTGVVLTLPRTTTSATVGTQTAQGVAVPASADLVVTDTAPPLGTFSSTLNVSRQAVERQAGTGNAAGRELALAMIRQQAAQFVSGSGASGQLLGLANQPGILAVTPGTPATAAGQALALLNAAQQVATNASVGMDQVVACMHPRRLAFLLQSGSAAREGGGPFYVSGIRCVTDPAIRTNLGGGTNEDEILVTWPPAVLWLEREPTTYNWEQFNAAGSPAQIRAAIWGMAAVAVRRPTAVARVFGGLVAPTF